MLESIFGNATVEKVLLYLQNYDAGYATEITNTFSISLSVVQKQLNRLEDGDQGVTPAEILELPSPRNLQGPPPPSHP